MEQACRSITLYKQGDFPYTHEKALEKNDRILIASPFSAFNAAGKKRYKNADTYLFNYTPAVNETAYIRDTLLNRSKNYDTIIFCLANAEGLSILKELEKSGKRIIVISGMSPVFILNLTFPDTILAMYSYSPYSFTASFAVLAGDFIPTGILPIKENTP